MTQHTLDPLRLPLRGLQLIEASAGTGKTFTLAALYVRLVLGHDGSATLGAGLFPPQILVMTFTEAATAELRERIRHRLASASRYFQTGDDALADPFLRSLHSEIDADFWPTCAWRLDMAAQWMDDAAIFTIHGWSSRMLKTHAFDSASLFTQSRVEDSERLRRIAAQDYWRHWMYALALDELPALQALGSTPQDLLDRLQPLWREAERAPGDAAAAPEAPDVLLPRWAQWQQRRTALEQPARAGWTPDVIAAINDAAAAKKIKGVQTRWLEGWFQQMADWAHGGDIDPKTLERFTSRVLVEKGWSQAANWLELDRLQDLHACLLDEPDVATGVLAHAAQEVDAAYQRAKAQAAQFDFSDLLKNLYHALQAPDGRLARAIRAQYPVALVDEFQDTDPWQFGALSKIYSTKPIDQLVQNPVLLENGDATATGLIMIGDPKQAIYSFRGADLATYLLARNQAQGIYTLPANYRSTDGMVQAVNTVFGQAQKPFGDVPFVHVTAANPKVLPLQVNGQPQVALTAWHVPFEGTPRQDDFLQHMAQVFASQIVRLLASSAARPGDMAVLVRDWREAQAIRDALSERAVRSVYLSERNSVYASAQAHDLWRILRAVAAPGNNRAVRAALATRTWGLSAQTMDGLFADETAWDAMVEQFMLWQRVWRTQGLLPMLYRLLHDQSLAGRLLQQGGPGERSLTNLLHLGELLQAASLELQGEGALIRHLEDQLRRPRMSGEAAELRLESDADLVQVITLHKSKGLEYPLVFLPFVSKFRAEAKDSPRPDDERLNEDIRLLYVALTRAKQALWLGAAQLRGDVDGDKPVVKSALSSLLGRSQSGDLMARLKTWASPHITVETAPQPTPDSYQPSATHTAHQSARLPLRLQTTGWWSASFSALTRDLAHAEAEPVSAPTLPTERDERLQDAQLDNAQATSTEPDAADLLSAEPPFNAFPAGSRYGTLLHDLLEWQANHHWPAAQPATATSPEWQTQLQRQAERLHLTPEHITLLDSWMSQLIKQSMPLDQVNNGLLAICLGAIAAPDRWVEMAFTLPVQRLGSQQLDALITRHLWPKLARPALQRRQLQGMLTGFMDLVLHHQGRYYVLDYKSNRLPGYAPAQLVQAMMAHRYDLQAALYLLALHRLLRSRLADYDYDQHVGGALYLFLRGVDQPGAGMLHLAAPKELIFALDAAIAPASQKEGAC